MSLDCPRQVAVPRKHSCISACPQCVFPLGISSQLHVELASLAPFSMGIMVAGISVCVCVWNLISWSAETESLRSEEFCNFLSVRNEHEAFPY